MVWGEPASTHILFDKETKGHFFVRNERDSVIAEVTKKEGNSLDLSLVPGLYSVEMEHPQKIFIAKQAIVAGQTLALTAANIALASQTSLEPRQTSTPQPVPAAEQPVVVSPAIPAQPVASAPPAVAAAQAPVPAAEQPVVVSPAIPPAQPVASAPPAVAAVQAPVPVAEQPVVVSPAIPAQPAASAPPVVAAVQTPVPDTSSEKKEKFKGSFFALEMGVAIPIGRSSKFPSEFPDDALGLESGPYFGFAHNTNLVQIHGFLGIGLYGQFGFQKNELSDQYEDYGYDVEPNSYRLEYEIGPSATFSLGHKLYVDTYFKAGFAFIIIPAMDYDEEADADYENEKDAVYDSLTNRWSDQHSDTTVFSNFAMVNDAIDASFGYGFAYGFGAKIRYSAVEIGLDFNFTTEKFNNDYDETEISISCIRLLIGYVF